MPESEKSLDLKLHSPAGVEPIIFHWPLTSGSGAVSGGLAWRFAGPSCGRLFLLLVFSIPLRHTFSHVLSSSLFPCPSCLLFSLAQSLIVLFVLVPSIPFICLTQTPFYRLRTSYSRCLSYVLSSLRRVTEVIDKSCFFFSY